MVQQTVHLLLPDQWKSCGGPWTPVWSLWSWSACRNQHRGSTAENRYGEKKKKKKYIIRVAPSLHFIQEVQKCRRNCGLTTGAGSNWEMTWWRKAARWAGRDLSCSMLLKLLHWPFDWNRGGTILWRSSFRSLLGICFIIICLLIWFTCSWSESK